jgi:hypothetical protein
VYGVEDAWKCLDKKWVLFNGDSNHVDTVYNLLYHVLGLKVNRPQVQSVQSVQSE